MKYIGEKLDEKEYEERNINDIISMSNEGNVDAMNELGVRYLYGKGVEKDEKKAFELFNSASEKDCIKAKFNLAMCYYKGYGIEQNDLVSFNILKELAEKYHHAKSYYYLGEFYFFGGPVEIDYKKAMEYFNKSLNYNKNVYNSKYYLGEMYMFGKGVNADYSKAKMYVEDILKEKDDAVYYKLALINSGEFGIEQNEEKSKEYFNKIEFDLCIAMIYYVIAVKPDEEQNLDEILKLLDLERELVDQLILLFPPKHPTRIYHNRLYYLKDEEYNDIVERLKNKIIICKKAKKFKSAITALSSDSDIIDLVRYIVG